MNEEWKEFRTAPGVFYRYSAAGALELLGPPESVASWRDLVDELNRANHLEEWKREHPLESPDQLHLFAQAVEKGIRKRLSGIPVLTRGKSGPERRSA